MEVPSKNQKRSCSVNINSVKKFILTLSAHCSLPVINKYDFKSENQTYKAENQSTTAEKIIENGNEKRKHAAHTFFDQKGNSDGIRPFSGKKCNSEGIPDRQTNKPK